MRLLEEGLPGLELMLDAIEHRYRISVRYLRGAGPERDPWLLMADALDALYGTFAESGRAYRELPEGSDVEYEGAYFSVEVEHTSPHLDALADAVLQGRDEPS